MNPYKFLKLHDKGVSSQILEILNNEGEKRPFELVLLLNRNQATVSISLRDLRIYGWVTYRVEGKARYFNVVLEAYETYENTCRIIKEYTDKSK